MTEVFVVGALHLDVVVDAPRLPRLDETLMGQAVAYRFGGKGGNQAVAAARMGAQVAMAGRVGSDSFATTVLGALAKANVDHTQVRQTPGATGMSVAIVETRGDYGAVVVSGVNRDIDAQDIILPDARVMLLQNEIPAAVNCALINRKPPGMQVILNAAPARATPEDLTGIDLLVVNRVEAAQMLEVTSENLDPDTAAKALIAQGPAAVIVTAGAQGAALHDGNTLAHVAPPRIAQGSTHGAGDAFVGALAADLARDIPLAEAAHFAAAAAALHVHTPPDARPALRRADVSF